MRISRDALIEVSTNDFLAFTDARHFFPQHGLDAKAWLTREQDGYYVSISWAGEQRDVEGGMMRENTHHNVYQVPDPVLEYKDKLFYVNLELRTWWRRYAEKRDSPATRQLTPLLYPAFKEFGEIIVADSFFLLR